MNSKKKIALLCDYGLDDVIATLYLFEYSHLFDTIDILPIAGNFPLDRSFINAKRILTHATNTPDNIRIVDTSSLDQYCEELYDIHGSDGMGGVLPDDYEEKAEIIAFEKWLEEVDESYTIVCLGPATVALDIMKRKGELPLIMMGGNIKEQPNYKGYEFNHGIDTKSFSECVKFPHMIATLDTCHCPHCNLNFFDFNKDTLLGRMLYRYKELSNSRGESICSVYDLTAIVYLVHPEKFDSYIAYDKDLNKLSVLKYIDDRPIIQ